MTSQRFLNDHVNAKDFSRSLMQGIMFPIIMFVVLLGKFLFPVVEFAKKVKLNFEYLQMIEKHEIISYFGGLTEDIAGFYPDSSPFSMFVFLFGVLTALSLFSFAFKKKSVNVYFSMGITRTRLWINRIAAGAIEIFAASFIPLLIVFIMNTSLFGFHKHQLALMAYYVFLYVTSGVAGLVFGALAASVSGSRIEMLITSLSASTILVVAISVFDNWKYYFLRGYVATSTTASRTNLLSPVSAIMEHSLFDRLITGKKVPEDLVITWKTDIFPLVLWTVLSGLVFLLGMYLFKKHKNENSNSFGKFSVASALNGAFVFFIGLEELSDIFYSLYVDRKINSRVLCILLCILGTVILFFVAELIIRRNLKAVRKMIPVYGGLLLVSLAALLVIYTGYFGTYNKLPEAKDISYVSMSYSDPLGKLSYYVDGSCPENYDTKDESFIKSDNPDDIKLCIEQFNKVKKDKHAEGRTMGNVSFVIKTKDGKFISREFPVYSDEILHDYSKSVFNSEYFHKVLKYKLTAVALDTEETEAAGYATYSVGMEFVNEIMSDQTTDGNTFNYLDVSLISDSDGTSDEDVMSSYTITPELNEALYNDLVKMTYDEYYGTKGEPVGAISYYMESLMLETVKYNMYSSWINFDNYDYSYSEKWSEEQEKTGMPFASSAILVYPQMTETLAALGDIQPSPQKTPVKAVLCPDKKFSALDAFEANAGFDDSMSSSVFTVGDGDLSNIPLHGGKLTGKLTEKDGGTYLDFLDIVYNENGVKLNRIDDTEKAKKIADASRSVYDTYGDDGRYVYVIFEDGSVAEKYLPEKSLSVLN